ncbi:hypothetical protein ACG873_03580 [Mesorhizobium sp. AaZ16]|uniref:hypothetical protein n=1 Tax=Mesorhizobium sp. AaZ16 TaxID=3402289 RepID=UPI00374E3246
MARGETIQSFIDSGDTLTAYCHNSRCHHRQVLEMTKLRDRLGPDHGAMHDDLVPLLVCSKCGGKKIGLIRSPKGNERRLPGGAHNSYQLAKDGR